MLNDYHLEDYINEDDPYMAIAHQAAQERHSVRYSYPIRHGQISTSQGYLSQIFSRLRSLKTSSSACHKNGTLLDRNN